MLDSERVQNLFARASKLPAHQRSPFLDGACLGDAALRAELDSMLRTHEEGDQVVDAPTVDVPRRLPSDDEATLAHSTSSPTLGGAPSEHAGQMIGRFKLLQCIGEGGFGSVWMAQQNEPVKRQ